MPAMSSNVYWKRTFKYKKYDQESNCWDNAVAENFFKSLKAKCVDQHKFTDEKRAALVVFEYIYIYQIQP